MAIGWGLSGWVPALATSNWSPAMSLNKASAISDRALLAVQTNKTRRFIFNSPHICFFVYPS
jgi:hypothetical protein